MTAELEANLGTTPVRSGFAFDTEALAAWMADHVAGFAGPMTVEQFKGGQSNPTYKLVTPGRSYVLRRKPPGQLLKGAHAIEREAKVLTGLEKAQFPVAHVYALCTDESVIGTWFYIMDMVEGRIFWDATLPEVPRPERAAIYEAMCATMAQLHAVDYKAVGLGDYGRPGNYFERQIGRWSAQYIEDLDAGRDDHMDRVLEWLSANIPESDETTLAHGDFRIDNMIFHPTRPEVIAVLDWELSTLGHPIVDFTYNLMMYRAPSAIPWGLADRDLGALGLPSEAEYVAAYCRRTGRETIANLDFYLVFNLFRLAAIIHGIKGRMLRGNAASAEADTMIPHIDVLAAAARKIAAAT